MELISIQRNISADLMCVCWDYANCQVCLHMRKFFAFTGVAWKSAVKATEGFDFESLVDGGAGLRRPS